MYQIIVVLLLSLLSLSSLAKSPGEGQVLVSQLRDIPYDCPTDGLGMAIQHAIQEPQLSAKNLFYLRIRQAQWFACKGFMSQARQELAKITEGQLEDSQYLEQDRLAARFFIASFGGEPGQSDPCPAYEQVLKATQGKYEELYASANVELMLECRTAPEETAVNLSSLYQIIQQHIDKGDEKGLSDLYHSLGLLYNRIGQNDLAAEQFYKAYQLSKPYYQGETLMMSLVNAIAANIFTGQFDLAKQRLEELWQENLAKPSLLSNAWVHYLQAQYAYEIHDFRQLRQSLQKFHVFQSQLTDETMDQDFRTLDAAACIHEQDISCIKAFIAYANKQRPYPDSDDIIYLRTLVAAYIAIDEPSDILPLYSRYNQVLDDRLRQQQAAGRILGVANMYRQLESLEDELKQARQERWLSALLALLFVLAAAVAVYVCRRYRKVNHDFATGGICPQTSLLKSLAQVSAAADGKINALVLFDLKAFKRDNPQLSYLSVDESSARICAIFESIVREHDLIGSLGGAQYLLCLRNLEESAVNQFIQRIHLHLEDHFYAREMAEQLKLQRCMTWFLSHDKFEEPHALLAQMRLSLSKLEEG